ncbi:MAG: DUF4177 domain-containing protein [Flavobacteriaceae bacterium]|nr:DUF4177 domain-containing protein [Flavobacteriaceae bacterium]
MVEYKVIKPDLGFRRHTEKLQDILNNEAVKGWKLYTSNVIGQGFFILTFERDKNR